MTPSTERPVRALTLASACGAILLSALYVASISGYWNISADSAAYLEWARSIAEGAGWGSRPINPPVTSLVFAIGLFLFPGSYFALNALSVAMLLAALALATILVARHSGKAVAWMVLLLSLASTDFYYTSTRLLSEPPYMLLSFGALLLLDRPESSEPTTLREVAGGLLLILTVMTRIIGIALAAALILHEMHGVFVRRRRARWGVVGWALSAFAALIAWELYTGESYAAGWFRMFVFNDPWTPAAGQMGISGLVERMRENVAALFATGSMLLHHVVIERSSTLLVDSLATAVIVSGMIVELRKRLTVTGLYVAIYAIVATLHMLGGGGLHPRFIVPVMPFFVFYAIVAAQTIWSLPRKAGNQWLTQTLLVVGAVWVAWYTILGFRHAERSSRAAHASPFGTYPIKLAANYDAQRIAMWMRDHTRPDERYATGQRAMFDAISERKGMPLVVGEVNPHAAFINHLRTNQMKYLLVDKRGTPLGDALLGLVRANGQIFKPVVDLQRAALYEIAPADTMVMQEVPASR